MARLFRVIDPGFLFGDRVDDRHLFMVRNTLSCLERRQSWEPAHVPHRDHLLLDVIDVVSDEAPSPLVENQAEAAAGMVSGSEVTARRVKTEIKVADLDRRTGFA